MSPQADFIVSNGTGAAVRSDLNVQFAAIVSNNSGTTEPATMYAYQWWADTTAGLLKLRNSANSGWVTIRQLDGEFSTVPVENGTAAAPSIFFKDSGTDTGLFSPGADQVAISTGGTVRLTSSTTAISSALPIDVPLASAATPSLTFTGDLDTGIFSPGADTLAITTAGTNRLHITSAGLVGIGNTGPDAKLHITGGASFTGGEANLAVTSSTTASVPATISSLNSDATLQIFAGGLGSGGSRGGQIDLKGGAAATDAGTILFRTGTGTGGTSQTEKARLDASGRLLVGISSHFGDGLLQIAGDAGASTGNPKITLRRNVALNTLGDGSGAGQIEFTYIDGGVGARIAGQCEASAATNDYPTRLVFSVTADGEASPTQRLRITNGGDVFIHSGSNFGDTGVSISPGGSGYYSKTAGTGATSRLRFANANGQVGEISTSGSTTTYATSSDYRLKENVTLLTGATDRLKQIPVHRFNFIADPDTTVDGFIAHEAQAVVPECVTGEKDAVDDDGKPVHQGIDQSKLVPLLTAALQEAIGEIESLKARLTAAGI
jgi:hypothetical protein